MSDKNLIFTIAATVLLLSCNRTRTENEPAGPELIIQKLESGGVFNSPEFELTSGYDEFRIYDNLQGLFFKGLPYHGKPTKVFCWYGVPEDLTPGEKIPAVVLVHGGGGSVFPDWVKKWTDRGYAAISIALEGQAAGIRDTENNPLPYWPTHEYSGPCRNGFFLDLDSEALQDQWFFHAVADVILAHSMIRTFDNIDTTRIGMTGISWGGILTNVIAGIDGRFVFAIPVYGCGYLQDTPTYDTQMKSLSDSSRQFYLGYWEPSNYIPLISMPTLYVNGTNDCHFTMNAYTRSFNALSVEKFIRVEHNMRHGHPPGWDPEAIYHFADYITGSGPSPLSFSFEGIEKNGRISFSYSGEIQEANFYYTTDTSDWACENYVWIEMKAEINETGHTVAALAPTGTEYYFVSGIMPGGYLYSSAMQQFKETK